MLFTVPVLTHVHENIIHPEDDTPCDNIINQKENETDYEIESVCGQSFGARRESHRQPGSEGCAIVVTEG